MEQVFERRPWLLPVILALLTTIYLKPLIFTTDPNQGLDGRDFQTMNYLLQENIVQTMQAGELPLWNPHIFIGHPIAGNPQSALFYPATWFIWLVGVIRGMNLSMAFHAWLGAWGMAVLMRRFRATYIGSLLAGVIYTMSGLAAARFYAGHYVQFVTFAWIPWIIAAYHYALARGTWRSMLPGIAATGMGVLAGHTQLLIYGGIGMLVLWVYYIAHAETDSVYRIVWQASRPLLVIVLSGALLGAALLFPSLELAQQSIRNGTDLTFANSYALPPAQMLTFALPGFFGNPKNAPYYYWGADFYEEFTAYAGLLPLLAIPLIFRWRRPENGYFLGLIALGIVLSLGLDASLMPLLWRWVPGATAFRGPSHALILVVIGLAGLTALLVTALQCSPLDERYEKLRPAVRVWLPVSIVLAFIGTLVFSGWYASASHVEPMPGRAEVVSGTFAEAGVILLGVWFVLWLWSDGDSRAVRWALPLTCALVILDAWHIGPTIMTTSLIQEEPIWTGARTHIPTGPDARVLAPLGHENYSEGTGHLNIYGYDPLITDTYNKLETFTDAADPSNRVDALLGVKYFMATKPYDKPDFKLLGIAYGGFYYERTDPAPRAWFAKTVTVEPNDDAIRDQIVTGTQSLVDNVFINQAIDCPSADGSDTGSTTNANTATITDYRANSLQIATSGTGGLLTLSDQYYPGWQVSIDGQPAQIVRTDIAFRGVCVPAGDHIVRYNYRPLSLIAGVVVSGIGWVTWLILAAVVLVRRRRVVWQQPAAVVA